LHVDAAADGGSTVNQCIGLRGCPHGRRQGGLPMIVHGQDFDRWARPVLRTPRACWRARRALLIATAAIAAVISIVGVTPSSRAAPIPSAGTAACAVGPPQARADPSLAIRLNEIRVTQPGTDLDEYVELIGPPRAPLDGITYVVLGDDVGGSGCIEEIVALDGHRIGDDGLFLIAQPSLTIVDASRPPDLVVWLNLENHDNLTHLLVRGFRGELGMDLDPGDVGRLECEPWDERLDGVATITAMIPPTPGAEWWYAPPVGPKRDGTTPYHIRRDPRCGTFCGIWQIGPDDPVHGHDTPGRPNRSGAPILDMPGDVNGDGAIDQFDLWLLLLHWEQEYRLGDFDGDGSIGPGDLAILLANWS